MFQSINRLSIALSILIMSLSVTLVQAEVLVKVDDRVDAEFSEMVVGHTAKTYDSSVVVTNTSSTDILAPIRVVITNIDRKNLRLANADGITAEGPYIELKLYGDRLGAGESSPPAAVSFLREAGKSGTTSSGNGKTKNDSFPVFDFDYSVLGGASAAPTSPTSFPYGLKPDTGKVDVLFRVNVPGGISAPPEAVILRNLSTRTDVSLNDDGVDGDVKSGDGIYVSTVVIDTTKLAIGDCLTYVGVVRADGMEVISAEYDLCATSFPLRVNASDTTKDNQVIIGLTSAVANEVLVIFERGFGEEQILSVLKKIDGEVTGTSLPSGFYQIRLPQTLSEKELLRIINELEKVDGAVNAGPNYIGSFATTPNDTQFGGQHALQLISSDSLAGTPNYVWDAGATGSSITVTVLDSGVDGAHSDLASQVLPEIFPGANSDTFGHGTEMAGIIGAATDNAIGLAAVARAATIESIVVSGDASVTQAEMIQGFNDAASPASSGTVINASFGVFGPLVAAIGMCGNIDTLITGGAVVVNSAGNDNNSSTGVWPGMCNDPALDGLLNAQQPGDFISSANKASYIVVGASNCSAGVCETDSKKSDSNYGSWVDVAAPGVAVQTTTISSVDPSEYTVSNGTSAAAASTSGAAAVLRSCGVGQAQVLTRIKDGATVAVTGDFNRINLYDSLASVNSAPTGVGLSNNLVDENVDTTGGYVIGTLTTSDTTVCDNHSYAITGGADMASFAITGPGGDQLTLDAGVLDFEADPSYSVTVTSTDFFGLTTIQALTINVNDLDEPPSISAQSRNIDENAINGTNIGGPIVASDPDGGAVLAFSITGGNSGGAFGINSSGQITVASSAALDYETTSSFSLTVEATDTNDTPPLSSLATVTVTVNPLNDNAPVFSSSGSPAVVENTTSVVMLTASDADLPGDSLTFGISADAVAANIDAAMFSIIGNQLSFISAPDHESPGDNGGNNVYNVRATVTDGFTTVSQDIVVTVTNEIELVTVPDVVGDTQATAVATLTAAQLTSTAESQGSFSVSTGQVFAQNPAAGASVNEGSQVTITVSSGSPGNPILVYTGQFVDYNDAFGDPYRRWHFNVTNWSDYPPEMFASTSAYGPCGLNIDPSRSWVNFFDASDDSYIYGFCELGSPDNMNGIWIAKPTGTPPPAAGVYIKIIDRAPGGLEYTSNVVSGAVLDFP